MQVLSVQCVSLTVDSDFQFDIYPLTTTVALSTDDCSLKTCINSHRPSGQ
jgi:hypothetical protein